MFIFNVVIKILYFFGNANIIIALFVCNENIIKLFNLIFSDFLWSNLFLFFCFPEFLFLNLSKEFSLWHKLTFFNPYIFATWRRKPLLFSLFQKLIIGFTEFISKVYKILTQRYRD